ncbi:hypothetical protein LWI29_024849 [Acer saccharum]|uniref:Uncharacterized protein n=1 Tax=Acer saccharum TaxID=4024 RepID=A0AA39RLJ7_ACESA|nr:hypothetical protein LWI29_024849 [Acer saccharum]
MAKPYNKDGRLIPQYNPHNEYGLDDFNEDYIGHGGSREGVNDKPAHYHGMDSDPTDGGRNGPVIKVAMGKEYPEITHGLCGFHMKMNLENIFKSHVICNLFYEASRAHRESEFSEKMQELSCINKRAYEYLMRVGPLRWSCVYCLVRHFRGMTSNIVECMNNCLRYARQLPITTLVEYIRDMTQT